MFFPSPQDIILTNYDPNDGRAILAFFDSAMRDVTKFDSDPGLRKNIGRLVDMGLGVFQGVEMHGLVGFVCLFGGAFPPAPRPSLIRSPFSFHAQFAVNLH